MLDIDYAVLNRVDVYLRAHGTVTRRAVLGGLVPATNASLGALGCWNCTCPSAWASTSCCCGSKTWARRSCLSTCPSRAPFTRRP
ncbi:hypothetical protein LP420_15210 [Massilia sp. B-10]|nr:hypothetical protein LP420_15210 [Massilia sp. B-10]